MGGKAHSPDPVATSTAQLHANEVNSSNPFLSNQYTQTGTNADGTPITSLSSQLSPQLQALYGQVGQHNAALDPNNLQSAFNQSQGAAYDKAMSYYQPQFDLQNKQLEDQLAQQGITAASAPDAYSTAHELQSNQQAFQRQQAYDSSFRTGLDAEGQLFTQGVNASNLPVSQLATLYSLGTGQGLGSSNSLAQLAQQKYQSELASQNNTDSGLYSLAGTGLTAYMMYAASAASAASDIRLKRDIRRLGEHAPGIGVYSYRYLWDRDDAPERIGVLAQEVEKVRPHAVHSDADGFKFVNYAAL